MPRPVEQADASQTRSQKEDHATIIYVDHHRDDHLHLQHLRRAVDCHLRLLHQGCLHESPLRSLQTLAFVLIVFANQATTYNNRERRHLWSSWPGKWVMISSGADIAAATVLAVAGIAMQSLPVALVAGSLAAAAVFALALDVLKVPVFRRLKIA